MPDSGDSGDRRQQIKLGVAAVLLVAAVALAWRGFGTGTPYDSAAVRGFKCAECGHDFDYTIKMGDMVPFECPKCDKMAGYVAEKCYWTKGADGQWKAKLKPTLVITKKSLGIDEKTYCPDCDRRVTGHNPMPPKELMDAARAEAG